MYKERTASDGTRCRSSGSTGAYDSVRLSLPFHAFTHSPPSATLSGSAPYVSPWSEGVSKTMANVKRASTADVPNVLGAQESKPRNNVGRKRLEAGKKE